MFVRLLSGMILAIGIILILLYTPVWTLGLVVFGAMLLVTGEFMGMARPDASAADLLILRVACTIVIGFPFIQEYVWPALDHSAAMLVGFLVLSIGRLARPEPVSQSMTRLSADGYAFLYVSLTFPYIFLLRDRPDGGWIVIMIMAITFLQDTGAYFAGRLLGRHALYPKISPKKTIEGAAGGLAAGIGVAFIARAYFPGHDVLTVVDCLALGGMGAIFGMVGDLIESMMKRAYGVKDSGTLIPGHGGALDRIDGLLICGPFCWLYLESMVQWSI